MKLKQLREQKNISQTELAKYLGVVRSTVCQYEKGNRIPDTETLIRIADYFNVTVDELLGRESIVTDDDRAKGWVDSEMVRVIPIETEMLEVFREVGAKRGKEAQKALIAVAKNMCD